jgi:anti-repressor protein
LGESSGGRKATEYIVTMDMAKELAMIEDNPKGKEARRYFIKVEKRQNKPLTYEQIMQNALLLADERVKALEHKIEVDKPKIIFADAISSTNTDLLIRDWAKTIGVQEKACRNWLIDKKLMFDANKNKENGKNAKYRASAYGISSGYIKQTETPVIHPNPSFPNRIGITVRITSKGQSQLTDKILNDLKPK